MKPTTWLVGLLACLLMTAGAALLPARAGSTGSDAAMLQALQARIESAAVLRGNFVQRKILRGFRHPLVSSGQFLVARSAGVIWDTAEPFASELVIAAQGIRVDGIEQVGGEQPAVARINRLLVAAIAGELPELQASFTMQAQLDEHSWSLRLQPHDAAMAQVIASIELSGQQHVERVSMLDGDGNRTEIELSAQRTQPPELTDAEAARFD